MRRIMLASATVLILALAAPAQAQRVGAYAVEGVSPSGERYSGSAQLETTGPDTWRVTWRLAGEVTTGSAQLAQNMLSDGYVYQRQAGVAVYQVRSDGVLEGFWTHGSDGGVGTERLLPR